MHDIFRETDAEDQSEYYERLRIGRMNITYFADYVDLLIKH